MDLAGFREFTRRVLEITDERELHREAISIPLDLVGAGEVRVEGRRVVIVGPEGDPADFLAALPDRLDTLDLDAVPRI
ncbi:MAG: hypothetical protein R3F20_05655 [Planctomycetota bacterium]